MLVFTLTVMLSGCGGGAKLPELSSSATVLAFGDSLTAGNGVATSNAYPAVLQTMLSRKVINSGVSGETTAEGLIRLPGVLRETRPDLLVLLEGGNDILRSKSLSKTKDNLGRMIQMAQKQNVAVVLVSVPTKSVLSKSAPFYAELAEEYDVPLEKSIIASLLRNPSMKSDPLHFNAAGYKALAEAIHDLMDDRGAI